MATVLSNSSATDAETQSADFGTPETYASQLARQARQASRQARQLSTADKDRWLKVCAATLRSRAEELLVANARDVAAAPGLGLNAAAVDRLTLNSARVEQLAATLEDVCTLPDPVGEVIEGYVRPNGLKVSRVRVPLGVVLFIYESRPNVTIDAAALCVKSGNAVILRGGKESLESNRAFASVLRDSLTEADLPTNLVQVVETSDRAVVGALLKRDAEIDVVIPRGGKSLIERIMAEARMPVIKHYDGICHVYVDKAADVDMALAILENSKCHRTGVCNAAECVLIHQDIANTFLPKMGEMFAKAGVEIRGCASTCAVIPAAKRVTDNDYHTEYLDKIISSKVVRDLAAAIDHVETYGSHHTDTIVTQDIAAADQFVQQVDSAAVMVNASTRFNDGGQLGLGAEIGISTDKFHARGPCGLREMTSYKFVVQGKGQVRQ